jgi:hypothetical protein
VRTRAAVVGYRNSGRAVDRTRLHSELREGTYMRRARGHVEAEKAKAFTNGSALNGAAFTGLFPAPIPTICLCSYCLHCTTNRANFLFPSHCCRQSPISTSLGASTVQLRTRLGLANGCRGNDLFLFGLPISPFRLVGLFLVEDAFWPFWLP